MKKVVVIGGGTGNFTILSGLRDYPISLSAIVSMADDGGSTGILRDELGVLPPGDVRQCLVALSNSSTLMRNLMNYRFDRGGLEGHSFGNLLLSSLEKVTGSFEKAVDEVSRILVINGKVIPVTTHEVRLKMILENQKILNGEKSIYLSKEISNGVKEIFLEPIPTVNPSAISEIEDADAVILGPGGLYTSLIPNLLVRGIPEALKRTKAKIIYVSNLMNRKGQTDGFKTSDYTKELIRFIGKDIFDYYLVNNQRPPESLVDQYSSEGELVENDILNDSKKSKKVVEGAFLGELKNSVKGDVLERSLIRHDPAKLASELIKIVNNI